jgi:hypothetical protein
MKSLIKYSFCENVHAGPLARWHIRELTDKGKKLGGGADSRSLCGRQVDWDLEVKLTEYHLANNTCLECLKKFDELG